MCSEGLRERYVNPYTDFAFKLLFGTDLNKEILIGFLNALFDGKQVIEDVIYLNTEHLGSKEIDRRAVFDVYCENEKGEKILIEMQRGEQQFFKDRSIYYATYPIREQAIKGEIWNYELKAVYVIGILNFALDDVSSSGFRHEVKLMDTTTHEVFFDKLTFVYLEMPKFHKTEQELDTLFDKWMFVLKNLARLMERPTSLQERVFNRLFEAAEIAQFSKENLYAYEESLKVYMERGSGETWACGTGTCATVAALTELGICPAGEDIHVQLRGGVLTIRVLPGRQLLMTGAAETVCEGTTEV